MKEIAVLMSAYNPDEQQLYMTVDSLIKSDLKVDIFIIDDGSLIPVKELIKKYSGDNIFVLRIEKNVGLTKALNFGLREILKHEYKYIARMDVGDKSREDRFSKQRQFLEDNENIDGVGSWYSFFDIRDGEIKKFLKTSTSNKEFIRKSKYNAPMSHPVWFFKREIFENLNGYDESYYVAQDYEFLCRALSNGYCLVNFPDYLVSCSEGDGGISASKRKEQLKNRLRIQLKYFNFLNIDSWMGACRTIVTMIIPLNIMNSLKKLVYKDA